MASGDHFPPELAELWTPLALIGQGGMGKVFRCRHRHLGQLAAVKLTRLPEDPAQAQRTLREARTLASLRHPNVVQVFDGGETRDGEAYLVMELLDGHTLDRPPGPRDPFDFMLQVARALQAIHDSGILHRDIKPSNLLLAEGERAVILDFGLAFDPERSRLTKTGTVAGTPDYLAPELLLGRDPGPTADWYAWGATLFVLVEGRLPYTFEQMRRFVGRRGALPDLTFQRLTDEDPRRALLARALLPDPRKRLACLSEILAVLEPQPNRAPSPAPSPSPVPVPASVAVPALDASGMAKPPPLPAAAWRRRMALLFLAVALGLGGLLWSSRESLRLGDGVGVPIPTRGLGEEVSETEGQEVSRERAARLRRVILAVSVRHPQRDRLFSYSSHALEIPRLAREHVQAAFEGEDSHFPLDWEELVGALNSWLVQLRDWRRDHPGAGDPFARPEVRVLLQEEAIPLLSHLIEDYLIAWVRYHDPRTALGRTGLMMKTQPRIRSFLETTSTLFFLLEEWSELPRSLVALRILLPRDLNFPGYPVEPFLGRVREILAAPRDAQEYWLTASALLHSMTFAAWIKEIAWVDRFLALENLERSLDGVTELLTDRERALLLGRLMVEIGRLARCREKGAVDRIGPWYQRVAGKMAALAETSSGIPLAAYSSAQRMATASLGVTYEDRPLEEILPPWHRQAVIVPLERILAELGSRGEMAPGDLSPPSEVSRWFPPATR